MAGMSELHQKSSFPFNATFPNIPVRSGIYIMLNACRKFIRHKQCRKEHLTNTNYVVPQ